MTGDGKGGRSIGKWISVLYRQFQIDMNKKLMPYDLNSSQFIFLIELYRQDHVSQDHLASALFIDKGVTARAIKKLEESGYVTRQINPDDKRCNIVSLTEKSHRFHGDLAAMLMDWNARLTRSLSDSEYDMMHGQLMRMAHDVME